MQESSTKKISISLPDSILKFIDDTRTTNRSNYIASILMDFKERKEKEELINAYKEYSEIKEDWEDWDNASASDIEVKL